MAELKFGVGTQTTVSGYKGVVNGERKKMINGIMIITKIEVLIAGLSDRNARAFCRVTAATHLSPTAAPLFLHPTCFVVMRPSL